MLGAALCRVLDNYKEARRERLTGHLLAHFVRSELPAALLAALGTTGPKTLIADASVGKGNWAAVPWAALFDSRVTRSAQEGFYPVYLFRAPMDGVYLSLIQGMTGMRSRWGEAARTDLRHKGNILRSALGEVPDGFDHCGSIKLGASARVARPAFYEAASVVAKFYSPADLSDEDRLVSDLRSLVDHYFQLIALDRVRELFPRPSLAHVESNLPPTQAPRSATSGTKPHVEGGSFVVTTRRDGHSLRVVARKGAAGEVAHVGWFDRDGQAEKTVGGVGVDVPASALGDLIDALCEIADGFESGEA